MPSRTDSRARALALLLVTVLVAGAIGFRLVWWQVLDRDRLVARALDQLAQVQLIPAQRGEISDANGLLLATSLHVDSVFAMPASVEDPHQASLLLVGMLDIPAAELEATLSSERAWVWLKRRVDPVISERVRALGLMGIGLVPETRRVYAMEGAQPGTSLAAQQLGFVNVDGEGQYGIEAALEEILAGAPGSVVAQEDVSGRRIAGSVYQLEPSVDGASLQLTLDAGLQHLLEEEMWDTYSKDRAKGISGLVMDVRTGAILAMATFPSYDANAYGSTDQALFNNPAVTRQYEPGSVMKPFTVAAALDAGVITPETVFVDDNHLEVSDRVIQNADRRWHPHGHGPLTAAEILALSNNVGAAKIGLTLGGARLYDALLRYGFASPTGIEMAGEAAGLVYSPSEAYGDLTTAQNAFGQGLLVTVVQLARGYAAIANGGLLVTPHVLAGWTTPDGQAHQPDLPQPVRVMRAETAATVLEMLTGAVDAGIAKGAAVKGYSIAGKTGTAQVAGPVRVRVKVGTDGSGRAVYETQTRTQYVEGWVDSSFIGIAPATNPRLVVLIVIHRPRTWSQFQMSKQPQAAFAELAPLMFDYLGIPPDRDRSTVARP